MMATENGIIVASQPADQRVADVRARLLVARAETQMSLTALKAEIAEKTDWRVWVRERPGTFIAVAFAIGLLIARRR